MQSILISEALEFPDAPELTEIGESAAEGLVAEIYRDIRATLGVPLVNLIYRYLATRPGALEWAWGWLRPHFVSGALPEQAQELRAAVAVQTYDWALDLGLTTEAERVAALAAAYNQANALNLMALTHLLSVDAPGEAQAIPRHRGDPGASPLPSPSVPHPGQTLPSLPAWTDLSPPEHALVLRLNRLADEPRPQVVASLYRHLTVWPAVLVPLASELSRLDVLGKLNAGRTEASRAATRIASACPLMPRADPIGSLDAGTLRCLRTFATVTLPKMVPIGLALHAACLRAATTTPADRT